MVGGVGSDIVEKTSEAASSIKGRLTSDSADEEQASEGEEDHEADGDGEHAGLVRGESESAHGEPRSGADERAREDTGISPQE